MKAADWIDRVKAVKGWETDYRAAKELGFHRNTIGNFRAGRAQTMDEDTALRVAQALGVDPAAVIIDQVAERSKTPAISAALHKVANQLCILCQVLGATVLIAPYAHTVRA